MPKRTYRARSVKSIDAQKLANLVAGVVLTIGLDIAKRIQFATLMLEDRTRLMTVKWDQLKAAEQNAAMALFSLLAKTAARVDLVMEPSGTYGDPLRHLFQSRGLNVYRMSPKRVHDYAEVYDGVPSLHDGKAAVLLARLHLDGFSSPWVQRTESRRELAALVNEIDLHQETIMRCKGRLEGWAARHWPELQTVLPLDRITLLELLAHYGSPTKIVRHRAEAFELMRRVAPSLAEGKIEAVLDSASDTMGVRATRTEAEYVKALAKEILRHLRALKPLRQRAEELGSRQVESVAQMRPVLGPTTAAVLYVDLGDPRDFGSPGSYEKAAGLNLKVRSSGQYAGLLRITKRGSSRARRWLYLAACRLVDQDPVIKAWYQKKVQRDGGRVRLKAIVAVMRKLTKALWHVARGATFDSTKLFDTKRLAA